MSRARERIAGRALGSLSAILLVAALAPAARADDDPVVAAVEAAGYHGAHVVSRRGLTVVEAHGRGQGALLAVRGTEVLELDHASGRHRAGDTRVSVKPFLGVKDLLDVAVTLAWWNGMGGGSTETHYLVRTGGALELACRFDGSSSSGMEDRRSSTSVEIHKIKSAPLIFEVVERTSSNRHGDELGSGDRHHEPNLLRYVVPDEGRCARKTGYGVPAR